MLKAVIEKKRVELVDRRGEARCLWEHYLVSERRVCGLMVLAESSFRYVSRRNDEPLRARLLAAAREKLGWGYRRLEILLDQTGEHVNHKRVYRLYREAGLMIRPSQNSTAPPARRNHEETPGDNFSPVRTGNGGH